MAISLIQYAYDSGIITKEQLEKAEQYKRETNVSEETAIRDMKLVTEERLLNIYS